MDMDQKDPSPLAADLLVGVEQIAAHLDQPVRRVRNLIDRHDLPVSRKGRIITSRRSWLDQYYGTSDEPAAGNRDAR
jgi:hypothetical protein